MPNSDIEPELPGLESKSHFGKNGITSPSPMQLAIKWFRHKVIGRPESTLKEALEEVLEENSPEMQSISEAEKNLLKNMIHFGELTVHDIMVPRTQILALPKQTSLADLKTHIISIGHTRIPVYAESLDQVEGFIHVKDLFPFVAGAKSFDIAMVMREILFVPPSMKIVDLLVRMRMSGCHIAIVIDEYGGTDGLVTMEDLFEELVGEIQDEHDEDHEELMVEWIGANIVEVDARVPILQLEETLNESFRKEGDDVDTLGGLVFAALGRVPIKGEVLHIHPNYKCEIIAADPRRIRRLRITKHA